LRWNQTWRTSQKWSQNDFDIKTISYPTKKEYVSGKNLILPS